MESEGDELLTAEDVIRILRISAGSLRGMRVRGRIPFVRIGRVIRYRRSDLRALIASREAQ